MAVAESHGTAPRKNAMSDESYWTRGFWLPPRVAKPGELLFEFFVERTKKFYRCELRDHVLEYGVDAPILRPVDLVSARRFDPRLNASRRSRELAIGWARKSGSLSSKVARDAVARPNSSRVTRSSDGGI